MIDYIISFLDALQSERNLSKNTVEAYRVDLSQFKAFLLENNVDSIALASADDIAKYCEHISDLSTATVQRKLSALRQLYKFMMLENIMPNDPTKNILRPKARRALPKVITATDVKKIFDVVDSRSNEERLRTRLMLMLLYGCGLRVSELITLKRNAIEGNFIRIYGKGAKERITPISDKIVECFKEYSHNDQSSHWLFPSANNPNKPITRQRVFQIIKQIAVEAGLDYSALSPHVLRHAFATHILDSGGDLLSVKNMLGHKSISTTEIYTHVTRSKLKEIVQTRHPLAKKKI